jgi:NCAIR mutase (PurE)-related protein
MEENNLKQLLTRLQKGETSVEEAFEQLKDLPFEMTDTACIDHHRGIRRGAPEIIFGEGKVLSDLVDIIGRMSEKGENILVTRLSEDKARAIEKKFPKSEYHQRARLLQWIQNPPEKRSEGIILVISAGTSDIPVAEEAVLTARFLGNHVKTIYDIGVAGIHRLFSFRNQLTEARVIIVVAGMEGALPSVVAGLVDRPVIAVPTSVGYGIGIQGIAALLGMLNSCATGVTVVNIDNGFGAGYAASMINRTD